MTKQSLIWTLLVLFLSTYAYADVTAVEGTIEKIDSSANTMVVKTSDGKEQTFQFNASTQVHGVDQARAADKDSFHGLKQGGTVAVHYTAAGNVQTAQEVDNVGPGGMKTTDGTLTKIDRTAKTMSVKTADGAEQGFQLTDHAAQDAGKGIATGAQKSAQVTVHYTEAAGQKVAHFFHIK